MIVKTIAYPAWQIKTVGDNPVVTPHGGVGYIAATDRHLNATAAQRHVVEPDASREWVYINNDGSVWLL